MREIGLGSALSVSFQRYPYPDGDVVTDLPASWGALPLVVTAPGRIVVPSPAGEAFWIGLVPASGHAPALMRVQVTTADGHITDALADTGLIPHGIPGIPDGRGWRPFAHDAGLRRVELQGADAAVLGVDVVRPDRFPGEPTGPLDPADVYGGWLLP